MISVDSFSGFVASVTPIHAIEVAATVISRTELADTAYPAFPAMKNPIATKNDTAIAAISLQALMRHQYHRSRYNRPEPAPIESSNSKLARADSSRNVMPAARIISSPVTRRPIIT